MLMRKMLIALMVLSVSGLVYAEDLVPLFEDELPNLGRNAEPLKEIHITPAELPDVQMELKNTDKKPVGFKTPAQRKKEAAKPMPAPQFGPRRVQLATETKLSSQASDKMAEQLRADMKQAQEQKEAEARAEQEAAEQAAREAELAAQAQMEMQTQQAQPNPLTGLFRELHDVHAFDISGFALGMTPDDVLEIADEAGYKLTKLEHGIPLHRTSVYKENCQSAQFHRVEDIEACVIAQAQEDEMHYISSMTFARPQTAEFIQVLFTGPSTENVVYKIYYENEGDNSLGFTRKNLAKKIARRDAFWKMVYDTYGYPDDPDTFVWGDPQKASMHAQMQGSNYNAYLILEDKEIYNMDLIDADTMGKELPRRHTFTFGTSEDR